MQTTRVNKIQQRKLAAKRGFQSLGSGGRRIIMAQINAAPPRRLDPVLKSQWVAALRSGKFKQGFGSLRAIEPVTGEYCHCALGVLCETLGLGAFEDVKKGSQSYCRHTFNGKSHQVYQPNQKEMIKIGLYPSMMDKVSLRNDEMMLTFHEMAKFIDKNF
jgi:hypothetical protein